LVAEKGHRVLFISLEMSLEQIATRLLAAESGVAYSRIQDGYLSSEQPQLLADANSRFINLPIIIDDKSGQNIVDIQTKARREQARAGLSMVVVDYLQIATSDSTSFEGVTMVSNGLKALAKDLNIPVIALSQLSRNIEQRDNKRPQLSDLRQTGAIEQDADLVMFLHYPDTRKMDEMEVDIQKHRNGGLGRVLFRFEKNKQQFEEIGGSTQ
jgi:replicative DNA helicase